MAFGPKAFYEEEAKFKNRDTKHILNILIRVFCECCTCDSMYIPIDILVGHEGHIIKVWD